MNLRSRVLVWTNRILSKFQQKLNLKKTELELTVTRKDHNELKGKKSKKKGYAGIQVSDERLIGYKKIAVLMAYCGQGYHGMQIQKTGLKTIECALLNAFVKSGIILEHHYETPQLTRFQRSSRTDKGVSAAGQVVSLKANICNFSEKVNEHLPPEIRVFGYKRVTNSFNCKSFADARTYSYTLPTYAFAPIEIETNERYRATEDVLANVNSVLDKFKGTHCFHNFTAGRTADDASCQRYIMKFECGKPFLDDGREFVVITVKGNSFILHQIRKMIGLAIAIVRGMVPLKIIVRSWCPHKLDLPMAPGLGLVLEQVHYDWYNGRFGKDGIHEPLFWDDYSEENSKFKDAYIYSYIINTEKNEKSMLKWLDTLTHYTYDLIDEMQMESSSVFSKMARQLMLSRKEEELLEMEQRADCTARNETLVNIEPQIQSQLS